MDKLGPIKTPDKSPTWSRTKISEITIHQQQLNSYDTNADIHDFTLDKFNGDLNNANKQEREDAEWIKKLLPEKYEVITNGSVPGGTDIAIRENSHDAIKLDCKTLGWSGHGWRVQLGSAKIEEYAKKYDGILYREETGERQVLPINEQTLKKMERPKKNGILKDIYTTLRKELRVNARDFIFDILDIPSSEATPTR